MSKKIEVIVDVQSEEVNITSNRVLTLTEQLRILRKEIQKAGPGKEQDLLIGKFNDINDELDKTNLKSREFLGALGTLPGPVGTFASSLDFAVNSLRNFTSFTFADIRTQAIGLAGDFGKIVANIGRATGITKVYTVLNNALAASFVKVGAGEVAAAAGARAFAAALTATGVGALVVALGFLISKLVEWTTSTKDADAANEALNATLKEQERLLQVDLKAIDNATRANVARAKIAGKTEKEIFDIQKKGSEDRLATLKKADKDNLKLIEQTTKSEVLTAEQKTAKLKELNEKSLKFGQDITQQIFDISNARDEFELQQIEKRRQKQEQANQKAIADNQKRNDKVREDNKTANDLLLQLQQENSVAAIEDKIKKQEQEFKNSKNNEEKSINALVISQEKRNLLLEQVDVKYALKQKELTKQKNVELLNEEVYALNLRKSKGEVGEEEYQRSLYEINKKYATDRKDIQQNELEYQQFLTEERKRLSEEDRANVNLNIQSQIDNLDRLNEILEFDFAADVERLHEKKRLLEEQEANELRNTELTEFQKNEIRKKYSDARTALIKQEVATERAAAEQKFNVQMAYAQALQGLGGIFQQIAGENKKLAILGIVIEKAAGLASIAINAKKNFIKDGGIKSPIAWANLAVAGVQAAGVIVSAVQGIAAINKAGSGDSGSTSTMGTDNNPNSAGNLGRNYEKGGLLKGPRHAQGGVMIEAEGGEAVMTRGAVTMFAPMLSMMNQMGGGTSFGNQLFIRPDAAAVEKPQQEQSPVIMKTYVVSNELTSEQEKLARLKDLSTL